MTAAVIVSAMVVIGGLAATYYFLFPSNMFISTNVWGGRRIVFSKTSVVIEPPPKHVKNGLDNIDPHIAKLAAPSTQYKSLLMFTLDGQRGGALAMRDGIVEAGFMVDWRQEPQKEDAIRIFFAELGTAPNMDYLAGNGLVRDATRVLSFPIKGDAAELTALTKRIMQELWDVRPDDELQISYQESDPPKK